MAVFPVGNTTVLLFALGQTFEDTHPDPARPEFCIPKHGPEESVMGQFLEGGKKLRQHFCFGVKTKDEVCVFLFLFGAEREEGGS